MEAVIKQWSSWILFKIKCSKFGYLDNNFNFCEHLMTDISWRSWIFLEHSDSDPGPSVPSNLWAEGADTARPARQEGPRGELPPDAGGEGWTHQGVQNTGKTRTYQGAQNTRKTRAHQGVQNTG